MEDKKMEHDGNGHQTHHTMQGHEHTNHQSVQPKQREADTPPDVMPGHEHHQHETEPVVMTPTSQAGEHTHPQVHDHAGMDHQDIQMMLFMSGSHKH